MSRLREIRKDEDLMVSPTLQRRLAHEAEFDNGTPGGIWFVLRRQSGAMVAVKGKPSLVAPHPAQQMWAMDMAQALNKHLHHDGLWVVGFTNPPPNAIMFLAGQALDAEPIYDRWIILFVDKDGDPQFTIENDDDFNVTLLRGPDDLIEECEVKWQAWHEHMRDNLGKKAVQGATFARAQGESAPSTSGVIVN